MLDLLEVNVIKENPRGQTMFGKFLEKKQSNLFKEI